MGNCSIRRRLWFGDNRQINFWATANATDDHSYARPSSKTQQVGPEEKEAFRTRAARHYRVLRNAENRAKSCDAECSLTGTIGDEGIVTLTHLLPPGCSQAQRDQMGVGNREDFRNVIFLATNIEKAFGRQRIAFDIGEYSFKFIILDPSVRDEKIYEGANESIGDFEGREVIIPIDIQLPYRRVLSHHAMWAYHEAKSKGWINDCIKFNDFGHSPVDNIKIINAEWPMFPEVPIEVCPRSPLSNVDTTTDCCCDLMELNTSPMKSRLSTSPNPNEKHPADRCVDGCCRVLLTRLSIGVIALLLAATGWGIQQYSSVHSTIYYFLIAILVYFLAVEGMFFDPPFLLLVSLVFTTNRRTAICS